MTARRGFTMIELLIVILIIAIMVVLALPAYKSFTFKAMSAEAMTNLRAIADSVWRYYVANGSFPDDMSQLDVKVGIMYEPSNCSTKYCEYGYVNEGNYIYMIAQVNVDPRDIPVGSAYQYMIGYHEGSTWYPNPQYDQMDNRWIREYSRLVVINKRGDVDGKGGWTG